MREPGGGGALAMTSARVSLFTTITCHFVTIMKSRLFLLFQLVAATTSPLERTASDYESETIQERYESYAKQGNVKLEDLDENTRFIFFRDDPFRRFMTRTSEWMNFMTWGCNLIF